MSKTFKKCEISLLLLICVFFGPARGIGWLALQELDTGNETGSPDCEVATHLLKAQTTDLVHLCESSPAEMMEIVEAARLTVSSCQNLFKHRRWNCSSIRQAGTTPDLYTGTREQAMVYALSSAALVYTLARACAAGTTPQCGCAPLPRGRSPAGFHWGGCGDNTRHAVRIARRVTDRHEKKRYRKRNSVNYRRGRDMPGRDMIEESMNHGIRLLYGRDPHDDTTSQLVALANLHNNKIGRRASTKSVTTQCKCHGVSGSCNVKTCWKAVSSDFEGSVGQALLGHYARSVEIRELPKGRAKSHPDDVTELVYVTRSPDYCIRDDRTGSLGTSGRECNETAVDSSGCGRMCCGRGYRSRVVEHIYRCHCKHIWCCRVKCKTCTELQTINTCI
ncbi:unnamed protein product [Bemisia tabaci]|uniref:Protein Wnt n=2 Tax=Bemisia tabaci TaxID=7038 RepID=A0A9P0A9Z5_BEMTA|nr:unnamed protein product [Bemisia tabaci]